MRISDVSIKNPVFAWMLMAALMIFGAISFSRMGVSQLPDVDFPNLNVSVALEGAAPEVMESTVVVPIEDALSAVEGVKSINSTSKTGTANITVEFELDRDINVALQEVQSKISQAQRFLPTDIDPPVISKSNPDDQPIMWLALTYDKDDPLFLMRYARDYLKDRFTTIPGVGDIQLGGYTEPALRVWVKPEALNRFNIAVTDIMEAIRSEHSEIPGGFIRTEKTNFNVRTMGEAKSVEEFKKIVISKRAGQALSDSSNTVRMEEVARIEEGLAEITRMSRFNGQPALGLGIKKQRGSNAVAVAQAVKAKMTEIEGQLPPGMKVNVNFDSTRFIEQSVKELTSHLILAVILTSLVCWIFLGSWSATFNVLLSILTSILGAFIGLYFFGFTLNTFTMLGLTLAIGIVVDDAIMVLENIFRYNEKGKDRVEAAIIGAREITFAALAASVAVIAIFLPVVFMKGVIGAFFLQFGITISLAVMLSLLEALTITPMRCATFVHHGVRTTAIGRSFESFVDWLVKSYDKSLRWSLSHRWKFLTFSLVLVVISFGTIKFLKTEMVPPQDQSLFLIRMTLPVGTSLEFTDKEAKKAEDWLQAQPEIRAVYAAIGGFGGGVSDANTAVMFVTLKPKNEREMGQFDFMQKARKELSQVSTAKFFMQDLSARGFGGGRGYPVEFNLLGSNWEKLTSQSELLMEEMRKSGLMVDVDTNFLKGMPEIQVVPDRTKAALYGITIKSIGETVGALIGGVRVGQYIKDGQRNDIIVKIDQQKDAKEEIKKLNIGNARANLIPITNVTQQIETASLQQISRYDRQRAISIYSNLAPGVSQQAALEFINQKGREILEPGYMVQQSGSSKTFKESMQSLIFALVLGFVVAYMILASQFNSFIDPVTILLALPFSFSGAFLGLWISSQTINIYSMIGILLLMGIVKKNSILLIEFTNTVRDRRNELGPGSANNALIEACPVRLRPILMTSLATITAAIPSALATGDGSETVKPMAITLIGGVMVSTLLTLYVVPIAYSLFDRFRKRDESQSLIKEAFAKVGNEALE